MTQHGALAVSQGDARRAHGRARLKKARAKVALRAKQIADRGTVEAISFARQEAFLEAWGAGELGENPMKLWRNQEDGRVRPTHIEQTLIGPIPLDAIFELHGVQFPPSPDFGCRCWHVLLP